MNLKDRSTTIEIMDDLSIDGPIIDQTLKELDTINRWLGGNAISLAAIKKMVSKQDHFHLTDLGCGGGDILIALAKWARKKGIHARFTGIDANPNIVHYARHNCRDYPEIEIVHENIFSDSFAQHETDIIHCCLFLHHFDQDQLVGLFRLFKKQARLGIIVNDLHRHFLAYYSILWLTALFSKSAMVKNDASLSVARGFKKQELAAILKSANIEQSSLQWKWAFRWKLIC